MLSLLKIAGKYQHKIYLYFHLVCLLLEKNLKLSNKHQLDKLYNFRRANYQWNKGIFFVSIFISQMVFNQIRSEDPYMMQQRELFGLTEVSLLLLRDDLLECLPPPIYYQIWFFWYLSIKISEIISTYIFLLLVWAY